jgi:hypothetical protein
MLRISSMADSVMCHGQMMVNGLPQLDILKATSRSGMSKVKQFAISSEYITTGVLCRFVHLT